MGELSRLLRLVGVAFLICAPGPGHADGLLSPVGELLHDIKASVVAKADALKGGSHPPPSTAAPSTSAASSTSLPNPTPTVAPTTQASQTTATPASTPSNPAPLNSSELLSFQIVESAQLVTQIIKLPNIYSLTPDAIPGLDSYPITLYTTLQYNATSGVGSVTSVAAELNGFLLNVDNLGNNTGFIGTFVNALFNGSYFSGFVNSTSDLQKVFTSPTSKRRSLLGVAAQSEIPVFHRQLQQSPNTNLGCLISKFVCGNINQRFGKVLCFGVATGATQLCKEISIKDPAILFTREGFPCLAVTLFSAICAFAAGTGADMVLDCSQLASQGKLPYCNVPPTTTNGGKLPGIPLPQQPGNCPTTGGSQCNNYCSETLFGIYRASGGRACQCCGLRGQCPFVFACCPASCCAGIDDCG